MVHTVVCLVFFAASSALNLCVVDAVPQYPSSVSQGNTPGTDAVTDEVSATDSPPSNAPPTNAPATNPPVVNIRLARESDEPALHFSCLGVPDGYYADPSSCRMYYICNQGVASHLPCGQGLYFDPLYSTCNNRENVLCNSTDTPLFCDARDDGNYPDPADCSKFYQCASSLTYPTSCQSGLLWNTDSNICDWPGNVNCTNRSFVFSCRDRGHGYYGDPYDCTVFYHCAGGKAYRRKCGDLTYWNALIGGCDYPANVQCIGESGASPP